MPYIDSYGFGRIVIDGRRYTRDVIISNEGVRDNWWRKEGHMLCKEDIREILDEEPEVFIIGTGAYGVMKVSGEVTELLESRGIEFRIEKTGDACRLYNEISKGENVVAALHLTC